MEITADIPKELLKGSSFRTIHLIFAFLTGIIIGCGVVFHQPLKSIFNPPLEVPIGHPFEINTISVVDYDDGNQALFVLLKSLDNRKVQCSLFIKTDPKKTLRYEYYGGSSKYEDFFEWYYIKNSIQKRVVWFSEIDNSIVLSSYNDRNQVVVKNYEYINTKDTISIKSNPENLFWINVNNMYATD